MRSFPTLLRAPAREKEQLSPFDGLKKLSCFYARGREKEKMLDCVTC